MRKRIWSLAGKGNFPYGQLSLTNKASTLTKNNKNTDEIFEATIKKSIT